MRRLLPLSLLLVLVSVTDTMAQQEPQFTHYMWNRLTYNPGYAGSRQGICATLIYHNQWSNFSGIDKEGAPVTQTFAIHAPLRLNQKTDLGVGLHIINDMEGWIGTTGFLATGAYRRRLSFAELGVGINAGMVQKSLGPSWRKKDENDPRIPGTVSSSTFDAGAGVHLTALNWYAGISALHLPQSKVSWDTPEGSAKYPVVSTYFFTAGYNYAGLMGGALEIQPSMFVKTDMAKLAFAVTATALYKQRFWAGINYRAERLTAASVMVGAYAINNLAIGLSYDIPTSSYSGAFGGTVELMANYCFKLSTTPKQDVWHKSPRFL